MKKYSKIIAIIAFITAVISGIGLSHQNTAKADTEYNPNQTYKTHFKKGNEENETIVTTSNNQQIKLIFKKGKIYSTKYIIENSWDYSLVKNISIKLEKNKTLQIKNGKFYSKGKLYTGNIQTKKTLVKPISGKAYFYMKGKIHKGKLQSGTFYMLDRGSIWPG
ncbi:hypothetical protein [Rummeliibacillus sp. POC4]|uniref:hypothetical protein n=1 Tax=Rummeliibacillus sp. POC4 TaxID=2305899 RepID=UPI000E6701FF|nr:hypothetical protein [Rummeliibacillus sp. POC4]RIJ69386.1 hypothetical protein D1606_01070 [Rummeliibacillus sp. POC4]